MSEGQRPYLELVKKGSIPTGGEPPHNDGMEARLSGIETRLDRVEQRMDSVDQRLGRVEAKVDHMDRELSQVKWYVIGSTLTILLAMVGTVLGTGIAIQQMTVSTFQAASQQAQQPTQQQPTVIVVPQTPSPASAPR